MAAHPWPELDPALMAPDAEREELRQVVRAVVERHADHEQVRAAADDECGYSVDLWRLLTRELEVARLAVPEAVGGAGFGMRELCVVLEETGAALLPEPVLASAALGCQALALSDDTAGFADLLDAALSGDLVVTVSVGGAALEAESAGDGWLVTGSRERVLQGAAAGALVVDAVTQDGTVLVVIDAAELEVTDRTTIDPTRRQADVRFDRARARVVVGAGRFAEVAQRLDLLALTAVAAEHAGIVSELLDRIVEYVGQREQFGRPIGSFQAIKHRLADVLVDRERTRSAVRYAAAAIDEAPSQAGLAVAVASTVCADAAIRTAHEAVQLHGGMGFTWEHRAHYYLRRVLGDEGLFGAAGEHRARIADLLGV